LLFCFNFANSAITPESTPVTIAPTIAPTTVAPTTIIIKTPAKLLCDFDLIILYTCNSPSNGTINLVTAENEAIQVSGTHVRGRTNADVELVEISRPHVMNFVPTKVFETFKKLTRFQMSNVNLTTLTTNAFMNCSFLELIEIMGNNFSLVPASFAESCTKLNSLTLRNNNIKSIDKDAFKGLANLKTLWMDGNDIASLDSFTFFYTPNLQNLYFASTKLKKIHSDTFAQLSLLRFEWQ
jgi:Leucine-rich repeat (LRR) protein